MKLRSILFGLLLLAMAMFGTQACYYDNAEELYPNIECDTVSVSFQNDINPIIQTNCTPCHSGSTPSGGLLLTSHAQIAAASNSGKIMDRISRSNGDPLLMPQTGKMGDCSIAIIQAWINQGTLNN
jgi:uncharacterized membrane protein